MKMLSGIICFLVIFYGVWAITLLFTKGCPKCKWLENVLKMDKRP